LLAVATTPVHYSSVTNGSAKKLGKIFIRNCSAVTGPEGQLNWYTRQFINRVFYKRYLILNTYAQYANWRTRI